MFKKDLPVYQHKDEILQLLSQNQVLIVQSPTGSGKTTQIPLILYEAGYADHGFVGVTQPRRIAVLGVTKFIASQIGGTTAAYKMRFGDTTTYETRIKIVTDGILLQELRVDPLLQDYSIVIVDEAHERTLNIDFLLGLLKRVLLERPDFKVIISSATINAEIFTRYFSDAPIINIDAVSYPVAVLYDSPATAGEEGLYQKIVQLIERIIVHENRPGDILVFLSGEKQIKCCLKMLQMTRFAKKIWILPLYGMLTQEDQEKVFLQPAKGKRKIVLSTNIAETSLTIDGITSVIDSGLCKENAYNPHTFISTLSEKSISRASANQRKGRAGRTQSGFCYRLYSKLDFDARPQFSLEEIYRTDLSEVVLRMASLGIKNFSDFDFLSKPNRSGIQGAVDTLKLLGALTKDEELSTVGMLMCEFPLLPRHARILVHAIMYYPHSAYYCCILTSFLSTNSPFILTDGQEEAARGAHLTFSGTYGDFTNYIRFFENYVESQDKELFCNTLHLDGKTMDEIVNIKEQLQTIVERHLGPLTQKLNMHDTLVCCGSGLIQFLCTKIRRGVYRGLTADKIFIHPGSSQFNADPQYIIAGEIVKTSRIYARSIAPINMQILKEIDTHIFQKLSQQSKIIAPASKHKKVVHKVDKKRRY
ncbi:MAG: helicase-related protein [Spirochaetia bacterium]